MAKGLKTGGRKKGSINRATAAKSAEIAASGLTPLDYMLNILRDIKKDASVRLEAAKAAAPYVHPKLANIEIAGKDGGPLEVHVVRFSDEPISVEDSNTSQMASPYLSDGSLVSFGKRHPPRSPGQS